MHDHREKLTDGPLLWIGLFVGALPVLGAMIGPHGWTTESTIGCLVALFSGFALLQRR